MSTAAAPGKGTIAIPEPDETMEPTPLEDVDAAVDTVAGSRTDWVETPILERIDLLEQCIADTLAVSEQWAESVADAKGIAPGSPLRGEPWITGPGPTLRNMRLLIETLGDIRETGRPQPPDVRLRPDGQVVVDAFPTGPMDRVAFRGFSGEIRVQRDVTLDETLSSMGRVYRPGGKDGGGVALVLGAGNISAIPPTDVLYKLYVEDRVCVLKMNPVNEYLGPVLARSLRALIDADLLRIVYGGVEVGRHLTDHDRVDEIHITGSDKTHDAIIFGTGEEGERRQREGEPRLDKRITSELGNVSPVIVVPGPWSDDEIAFHGDNIASMMVHNAGFNCIAARMIVQHRRWARRDDLLDAVRDSLRRAELRSAYYPGARDRWKAFVDEHPGAETFGDEGPDQLPWTLLSGLDPGDTGDIAFNTEAFCGLFGEVALDAPRSVPEYLEQAVAWCNETLWGSLAATIIVHPDSLGDPAVEAAVERAIDDLEYGNVVLNHWSGIPYGVTSLSWGAYPGHPLDDIQSGRGVVHNTYMVENIEKSVLRGPFTMTPKPSWFHTHRTMDEIGPKLAEFSADPRLSQIPSFLWSALRG